MQREVVITNGYGLHARPAALLVEKMKSFDASVQITVGQESANAASIMGLLVLGASTGDRASIVAEGAEAGAALDAVVEILTMEE